MIIATDRQPGRRPAINALRKEDGLAPFHTGHPEIDDFYDYPLVYDAKAGTMVPDKGGSNG